MTTLRTFSACAKGQCIGDCVHTLIIEGKHLAKILDERCLLLPLQLLLALEFAGGEHEKAHQPSLVDERERFALEHILLAPGHALHQSRSVVYGNLLYKFERAITRDPRGDERVDMWSDGWDYGWSERDSILSCLWRDSL